MRVEISNSRSETMIQSSFYIYLYLFFLSQVPPLFLC
uniref:Uncharacterized protein n=1 Tax=Arundo donax TaxID=35708 RepID=A0A0A9A6T7_ARUDO